MTVIDKALKRKVFAALAAVFILGIAVGSLSTGGYIWYRLQAFLEGGPKEVRAMILDHLTGVLSLTDEQRLKIDPVIKKIQEGLAQHRVETRWRTDKMLLPLVNEFDAILDEKQKPIFKAMIVKLTAKFDRADKELLGDNVTYVNMTPTPAPNP